MSVVTSELRSVVPAHWKVCKLGDVVKLSSGTTPSRSERARYFDGGSIPWVKTGDLNNGLIQVTEENITPTAVKECSVRIYPPNTVLVAMYGGFRQIGRTGRLASDSAINQALSALQIKNGNLEELYLQSWLNSRVSTWKQFAASSRKDPNITGTDVAAFPIAFPPLSEQKKIAGILSTWDRAIELTEKLIAAKQKRKEAFMQHLLTGKVRLPGYKGQKWQLRTIGQFLVESRIPGSDGANAKKITVKLYGKGVLPKSESRKGSSATQYYRRSAGQFIYSKLDFLNGAFGVIPADMDGYESTLDLPAFDISGDLDARWFLGFVSREQFYSRGFSFANGGRKARRVNPRDFLNIKIELPSLPEQRAIANILEVAAQEVLHLALKLDALKRQKKGLMQQLFTGKLRVSLESGATVEVNA